MNQTRCEELTRIANRIRLGVLEGVYHAGSGHPGGSLSIADILAYLYFEDLHIDPKHPGWEDRDRLILSKGHTAPALYAALAERGYFDKAELKTLRKPDSFLQGHPDMKGTPGVDMSTGSLGLGVSAACGMALAGKSAGKPYRVYTILGDGECEEGQVWEAMMFASQYKLNNLCIIVDVNGLQIDGATKDVMNTAPLENRFSEFGAYVITIDAHDFYEMDMAFHSVRNIVRWNDRPSVILANSVKGKGVSFMENQVGWHGKAPNAEQYEAAVAELKPLAGL